MKLNLNGLLRARDQIEYKLNKLFLSAWKWISFFLLSLHNGSSPVQTSRSWDDFASHENHDLWQWTRLTSLGKYLSNRFTLLSGGGNKCTSWCGTDMSARCCQDWVVIQVGLGNWNPAKKWNNTRIQRALIFNGEKCPPFCFYYRFQCFGMTNR